MEINQEIVQKFENLKLMKNESADNIIEYKDLMDNLKKGREVKYSLLCLFEIIRIKKNSDFLTSREKDKIIVALINILKTDFIDLSTFIEENIVKHFSLELQTSKFMSHIKTVNAQNLRHFQLILAELLEQSNNPEVIIKNLLLQIAKDKSYNDVFNKSKKDYSEIINSEMFNMNDKDYVDVFCNLEKFSGHKLRNIGESKTTVKFGDKIRYVEAAIEKGFINEILVFYYNDKEKKIRQILAKSKFAFNKNIIMRFLNDNDAHVRLNIVNNLDVEECINHDVDVYDRLLDVDEPVRNATFIFYDKLYNYIKIHSLSNFIAFLEDENTLPGQKRMKLTSLDGEDDVNRKRSENYFAKFTLNLFKGLLTSLKAEYENVLSRYNFSFEFYHQFIQEAGVERYAKTLDHHDLKSYKSLDDERKRTFFMIYTGILNEEDIRSLINEDLVSAMYYLKDKEVITPYLNDIINCFKRESLSLPLTITILEKLENYKGVIPSIEISSPSDLLMASFLLNEVDLSTFDSSFDKIFYLAKNKQSVMELIKDSELTDCQVFELLICSGELEILSYFCDRILENNDVFFKLFQERAKLIERVSGASLDQFFKRNIHNTYLFFLMTGRIKICDTEFFINLVHFVSKSSTNKMKVSKLFKIYLQNIPKSSYYEFATICYALKTKSMYSTEDQEYNKIQDMDVMLYNIISTVLNFNVYKILEMDFNLDKFYDVIEENLQIVLTSQ